MTDRESSVVLTFGDFSVDLRERTLRKGGMRLKLHGQPFEILVLLLKNSGEVVTREELQAQLWHGDVFVDFENGLNAAVKKLRQTLGDSAECPRYIETLSRVGYRFLMPVTQVDSPKVAQPTPLPDQLSCGQLATVQVPAHASIHRRLPYRGFMFAAVAVLLLGCVGMLWFQKHSAKGT